MQPQPLAGWPGPARVITWHAYFYRRLWRTNVIGQFLQPMFYLLGLGVGVGALVDRNAESLVTLNAVSYAAFVAPGLMMSMAMNIGSNESMWPVMGGMKWDRSYHAATSTPLSPRDIVLGHGLWLGLRGVIAAAAVAVALACFRDTRSWGLLGAIPVAGLLAVSFALPIMTYSIGAKADGSFAAIQRFVVIPLFLFGGAFYPLSQLPDWVGLIAKAFPLWHGVEVAREMTTAVEPTMSVGQAAAHLAYVASFAVFGGVLATRRLTRALFT
jgi:lipooligosaccharide transport system permease protein